MPCTALFGENTSPNPPGGITKFTFRTPTAHTKAYVSYPQGKQKPAVSCPQFCRMCGMETWAHNPFPGGLLPPGAGNCWVEGVSEEKLHSGSCAFAASSKTWLLVPLFFFFSVCELVPVTKKKKEEKARLLSSQPCLKAPVHLAPDETRQPTVIKHSVIYQQSGPSWWKHGHGRSRHEEVDLMWGSACFLFYMYLQGQPHRPLPCFEECMLELKPLFTWIFPEFGLCWGGPGLACPLLGSADAEKGVSQIPVTPLFFFSPFPPSVAHVRAQTTPLTYKAEPVIVPTSYWTEALASEGSTPGRFFFTCWEGRKKRRSNGKRRHAVCRSILLRVVHLHHFVLLPAAWDCRYCLLH